MALLSRNRPQIPLFQCPRFSGVPKPSFSETLIARHSKISFSSISVSSILRYAPLPLVCCNGNLSFEECNMASSAKIFIKGLPQSISEGRLTKVFSEYGEISQVDLPLDRESRQPLGYAYIWFGNEGSAQLAVKEMNGKVHLCYNCKARIKKSEE